MTLSDSDIHPVKGPARWVVSELTQTSGMDLLVMATAGRPGVSDLVIGTTAEVIIDNMGCSVLAVKLMGWASPLMLEQAANATRQIALLQQMITDSIHPMRYGCTI